MKAIMVMFDSLNRRYLPPYGQTRVLAPNFDRLARHTARFENCYAGSMPCIPARRELHTGRYNFMHRAWGPLEPFDDSMPALLGEAGVYTHLVTDHRHYWGDGGATYHGRYSSFEFVRGQEGDAWKGQVADPEVPEIAPLLQPRSDIIWRRDWVNRPHIADEAMHPQTKTFDLGLEFLSTNVEQDGWFLTIESYDPHEPFFTPERFQRLYEIDYEGPHHDWPSYRRAVESEGEADHLRAQYQALVSMCDESLGRVLDAMDEHNLWDDTMLIVATDHGLLLGEQGWWGKGVQPWYDENIHTPLFIWDPRTRVADETRDALVQTIDIPATLLDYFSVPAPVDLHGKSLGGVVATDEPVRVAGLFGSFGGHINITDGRFVYMRASADARNTPLHNYTLMPTHISSHFSAAELTSARLVDPFVFTKGMPVLQTPAIAHGNPHFFGSMLFDLSVDPQQEHPLIDDDVERRMATLMVELMRANDAPADQFERLGLPVTGEVGEEHLLVRLQRDAVETARADPPARALFAVESPAIARRVDELLANERQREALERHFPEVIASPSFSAYSVRSLWEIALVLPIITTARLRAFEEDLACQE